MINFKKRYKFWLWVLVVVLGSIASPVSAKENFIITVGQDKVFTEFNYNEAWFENDPNNSEPWPDQREAYSGGNIARVSLSATPSHAGVAQAWIGVKIEWNLGKHTWEEVQNWPVMLTISFSYQIEAYWTEGNGSANAGVNLHNVTGPWYGWIGRQAGYPGASSQTIDQTFTTTLDGHLLTVGEIEGWGRKILGQVYCQAHSIYKEDEKGNPIGTTHSSSSEVTINSIKVTFVNHGNNNLGQPHDSNASQGEPVNIINGNMYIIKTDLSTSAPGIPFEFIRAYNSKDSVNGSFGTSTTHNFNVKLTPPQDSTSSALITDGDGGDITFYQTSPNVFEAMTGEYSTLTKTDSGFAWEKKEKITYSFNLEGKLQSIKDKNNNTNSLSYDADGRLKTITDTAGRNYNFTYDTNNHITSIADTTGRTVIYEYDSNSNLAKITDPAGVVTTYEYNDTSDVHNITKQTVQAEDDQFIYTYSYDNQDRCINATGQNNELGYSFEYKSDEDKTVVTDSKGNVTTKHYNSNNMITQIDYPDSGTETFTWDSSLNKTSETLQDGSTWQYEYDGNGNITKITDPLGNYKVMVYDSDDNLASLTDELGRTIKYTYDDNGNLTKITYPDTTTNTFTYNTRGQTLTITDTAEKTTTFSYDEHGNLTFTTDPEGYAVTYDYDSLGRSSSMTDARGKVTKYQYDGLNRITEITDALNGKISNTHTIAGLGSLTDQNNNKTSFQYDTLNQLTGVTDPLTKTKQYIYDDMGNLASLTDFDGSATTYAYNNMNRLTTITYPDNSQVTFDYNTVGRLTKSKNYTGTSTYTYDAIGRVTSYGWSGAFVCFEYDAVGNLKYLTYPGSQKVSYTYDDRNRLSRVKDWVGRETKYSYDSRGLLTEVSLPNGAKAQYDYDDAGRMTGLRNLNKDSTVIASYSYTLDANGNITSETSNQPLDLVIQPQSTNLSYGSDNRLLSVDGASLTYDQNGNIRGAYGATLLYDFENRLKNIASTQDTWEFDYDGRGNRVGIRHNDNTRRFLIDPRGMTQVLAEYDGDGNLIASYIYGFGLIYKVDTAGNAYYYHYNFTGNTVAMTDTDGNIVNKYAYTPYGVLTGSEETVSNPFRYVGKYGAMDDNTGLLYMRARYYSPDVGRFITKDPIGFAGGVNLYGYAHDNPINHADPTGLKVGIISESLLNDIGDLLDEVVNSIEKMSKFEKDWLRSYGVLNGLDYELEWERNERLEAEKAHLKYYKQINFIVVPSSWIVPWYRQLKNHDTNGDGIVAGNELESYINTIKKDFETSISKICKK
ncbi:MAG: RHS repeat protein [Planctomycetes bacterium]|nr:RHS repeat protein [Planctomycetota bacterium]